MQIKFVHPHTRGLHVFRSLPLPLALQGDPSFKSSRSRERRDSSASISSESEDGEFDDDRGSRDRDDKRSKNKPKDDDDNDYRDRDGDKDAEKTTLYELGRARITRDMLAKYCHYNGFEDFVKGGWVRYNVGPDATGKPCYRLCEIVGQ